MREFGYVEGRDYAFESRYSDGDFARLPLLAEELVRFKPVVIIVSNTSAALAIKQLTTSTPIVVPWVAFPQQRLENAHMRRWASASIAPS